MERKTYELRAEDITRLKALPKVAGYAFRFWEVLCGELGLDYQTVIARPGYKFSALPIGHDKYWCWPSKIKCPELKPWWDGKDAPQR